MLIHIHYDSEIIYLLNLFLMISMMIVIFFPKKKIQDVHDIHIYFY